MLEWLLEDMGCEVMTAGDGREALELIARRNPDVILLDIRMPVMGGLEFARAYRQLPGPHAPLVVMTAQPTAGTVADELGAACFIEKPFDLAELEGSVRRCLGL